MDVYTALRRSLLLQLAVTAASCGPAPDAGDTDGPDTDGAGHVDTDVAVAETDSGRADTGAAPDTDTDADADTGLADSDLVGVVDCPAEIDVDQLGTSPHDEGGYTLSCTDTYTTRAACLTGCDASCQRELGEAFTEQLDTATYQMSTFVCGPVWVDRSCCVVADVEFAVVGRPLQVGAEARVAPAVGRHGWVAATPVGVPSDERRAEVALAWTRLGLAEHASVAAFARVTLELLALGAPADLVADAARAMSDEIAHARACFGIASAWTGAPVGPGPLDTRGIVPAHSAEAVLIDTLASGCVAETIASAEAAVAASLCEDPALARILREIADDEARHAALAWRIARWIVSTQPELRSLVRPTLARALEAAARRPVRDVGAPRQGLLGAAERRDVIARVRDEVIAPVTEALAA